MLFFKKFHLILVYIRLQSFRRSPWPAEWRWVFSLASHHFFNRSLQRLVECIHNGQFLAGPSKLYQPMTLIPSSSISYSLSPCASSASTVSLSPRSCDSGPVMSDGRPFKSIGGASVEYFLFFDVILRNRGVVVYTCQSNAYSCRLG